MRNDNRRFDADHFTLQLKVVALKTVNDLAAEMGVQVTDIEAWISGEECPSVPMEAAAYHIMFNGPSTPTQDLVEEFGPLLTVSLSVMHMSESALAEDLGVAQSTVHSWCNGTVCPSSDIMHVVKQQVMWYDEMLETSVLKNTLFSEAIKSL